MGSTPHRLVKFKDEGCSIIIWGGGVSDVNKKIAIKIIAIIPFYPPPDKLMRNGVALDVRKSVCPHFVAGADLENPRGDFFHIAHASLRV